MLCKIYSVFILKENLLKIHFDVRMGYCAAVSQVSLSTWILSWKIRRHRTSEPITRADTATLPVS